MINNNIIKGLSLLLLFNAVITLSACTDPIETTPDNIINDSNGVKITLEWSTGGSITNSIEEVDIDLDLSLGSVIVDESSNSFSFENVTLDSFFADGIYDLNLYYYSGTSSVDYTIYIVGASPDVTRTLEYKGVFSATDKGITITDLTIKKTGNKYVITD